MGSKKIKLSASTLPSRTLPEKSQQQKALTPEEYAFVRSAEVQTKSERPSDPQLPPWKEPPKPKEMAVIYGRVPKELAEQFDFVCRNSDMNKQKNLEKAVAQYVQKFFDEHAINSKEY